MSIKTLTILAGELILLLPLALRSRTFSRAGIALPFNPYTGHVHSYSSATLERVWGDQDFVMLFLLVIYSVKGQC